MDRIKSFPYHAFGDKELKDWRFSDWDSLSSGDTKDYLETIHHNLNVGFYYCAGVLNWMRDRYDSCLFIGEKTQEQLNELKIKTGIYLLIAVAGPIATMFTVVQSLSEEVLLFFLKKGQFKYI